MGSLSALQERAYRQPFSGSTLTVPPREVLPSGEVLGLSLNK